MRRPTLHVLAGLPGAGKSTRAAAIIAETGAVLVSRDDLRLALRTEIHVGLMNGVMETAARVLLEAGHDVTIDAWNLHPGDRATWTSLAQALGAELVWERLDTPLELCIRRDAERPEPNGEARVRAAAATYAIAA